MNKLTQLLSGARIKRASYKDGTLRLVFYPRGSPGYKTAEIQSTTTAYGDAELQAELVTRKRKTIFEEDKVAIE